VVPLSAAGRTPTRRSLITSSSWLTSEVEPVAYLGILLPWLERRIGRSWLAAAIVVVIWAREHVFFPLLTDDGGLDLAFAADRVVSVLPFLAV
jgi:hypothetical protein